MKKSAMHSDLSRQIEHLVQAHLAALQAEAEAALTRAFAKVRPKNSSMSKAERPKTIGRRRGREEIEALSERLLALVVETPGSSMTALAPQLGLSPRELQRPMRLLKKSGLVRSVGQRHLTRYFPLAPKANAANG